MLFNCRPIFFLFLPATVFVITMLMREHRRYKIAMLIMDNKIMHIQIAREECSDNRPGVPATTRDIGIVISCFGVLIDTNAFKFNIDSIKLKGVEIGRETICLYYGAEKVTKKIEILHGTIDEQEMQSYVDRFCYETGITPVVRD